MDKIPYRIPEYHKMVWKAAWDETVAYHIKDLQNLVGNVVIALISGFAYAVYSYNKQGTMIDWFGVALSVLIGFFGWGVIVFFRNLIWTIPAKLYRHRETEAYLYTWNDIEIIPFRFPPSFGN